MTIIRRSWAKLPRRARDFIRSLLEDCFPCKLPTGRPLVKGDIVVGGFLGTASGLGQSARWMLHFFKTAGLPAYGANFSKLSVIEENFEGGPLWPPQAAPSGIIILHMNPSLFPLGAYKSLGKARLLPRYIVGYWAWELDVAPPRWRRALDALDEIWVPSHFVASGLKKLAPEKTIRVMPCLVDVTSYPTKPAIDPLPQCAGRTIVFFMYDVGSTHARKNPCGVIEAFKKAATENPEACLVLKINNSHLWPQSAEMVHRVAEGASNIIILEEKFSAAMMKNLLARIDIAISLHRSEGFGLLMAEAMAAAKPVIATGWSGNMDFMDASCAVLIDYKLVKTEDPQHLYDKYGTEWAEPDIDHAARELRRLLHDPAERQRLGNAAREHIGHYLSQRDCLSLMPDIFWQSLADPSWRERLLGIEQPKNL